VIRPCCTIAGSRQLPFVVADSALLNSLGYFATRRGSNLRDGSSGSGGGSGGGGDGGGEELLASFLFELFLQHYVL
jgi:hypothetical protein